MSEIKMSAAEMKEAMSEMEGLLCYLWLQNYEAKGIKVKGLSRKEMMLSILMKGGLWSVKDLAAEMGKRAGKDISSRNVSSLLSYLRDDIESGKIEGELSRVGRGVGKLKFSK